VLAASIIRAMMTFKQVRQDTLREIMNYARQVKVKLSRYMPWWHMGGEEV
jgi:hypothetical protein